MYTSGGEIEWSCLPQPSPRVGINTRLNRCAGCLEQQRPRLHSEIGCVFREQGFLYSDNTAAIPCGTVYHLTCYHAGPPFKTRLPNNKGLHFPHGADPTLFPNFTCEACQVRAVLDRELRTTAEDIHLLRLERMRMLDIMNRLAEGSMRTYKYPLRRIQTFEGRFGVRILRPTSSVTSIYRLLLKLL